MEGKEGEREELLRAGLFGVNEVTIPVPAFVLFLSSSRFSGDRVLVEPCAGVRHGRRNG